MTDRNVNPVYDPLLIEKPYTPGTSVVVPAPGAPVQEVVPTVAPTTPATVHPVTKPSHTLTGEQLVVSRGGSAAGKTATFKRRMGGRNVATVTSVVSLGNAQSLKTHPIFTDANGVEYIAHDGKNFRKITDLNLNIVRRETVTRG